MECICCINKDNQIKRLNRRIKIFQDRYEELQNKLYDLKSKTNKLSKINEDTMKFNITIVDRLQIPDILKDDSVIKWIKLDPFWTKRKQNSENQKFEKEFGVTNIIKYIDKDFDKSNCNWSGYFGEEIVKCLLKINGHKVRKARKIGNFIPDLETDDYVIEVKTRTYSTPGTAGEKVYGCPWKYIDIPTLYKKPLKIIVLAYQEYEALNKFKILNDDITENKKNVIDFFKQKKIEIIKASDLLNFDYIQ